MKTGYRSDRIGNIALGYQISSRQPEITQLNPITVYRTPFLVQVGNPDLQGPLSRSLNARYAHFFKKALFNISASSEFEKTDRMIVMDRSIEFDPDAHTLTTITQLVNADGGSRQSHDLNLSKTLGKSRSTWKYTGSLDQRQTPYLTEGVVGTRHYLSQDHRMTYLVTVAPWLDIAPDLRYQAVENRYTHGSFASRSYYRMFFTELKINVFLPKEVRINLNTSQMINRTTNSLTDEAPFVLNANIEKRIFRNKSGVISFVVMDLARQNAFTHYVSDEYGYRNTVTNPDSRYFLLQFAWKPEYWSKSNVSDGD